MSYDNRRSKKWPDHLTAEEYEVSQALTRAGYSYDPDQFRSFVPTRVLYRVYREYVAGLRYRNYEDEIPVDLNIHQFGAALCRVFDLTPVEKVRRRWHGRKSWGYLGIIGPNSLETRDEPGRPRHD